MTASDWVYLDVEKIVLESQDAFLLRIDGEHYWIPISQIADPENYNAGMKNCTVSVTRWIAEKKG